MATPVRGGQPFVQRVTGATTTGAQLMPPGPTSFVQVSNDGAEALRLFFSLQDYTDQVNYIELPATTGFWDGPAEIAASPGTASGRDAIWYRSAAATTDFQVVFYVRRG